MVVVGRGWGRGCGGGGGGGHAGWGGFGILGLSTPIQVLVEGPLSFKGHFPFKGRA